MSSHHHKAPLICSQLMAIYKFVVKSGRRRKTEQMQKILAPLIIRRDDLKFATTDY